jgi:hypothetical protein
MLASWEGTTRPGWNWSVTSVIEDCEVLIENPSSACENTAIDALGLWEEVSFVEGDNYVEMLARRKLK